MQNENRQNPQDHNTLDSGTAKAGEFQASPAAPGQNAPQDFIRMKEWVVEASADAKRARVVAEQTREDLKDIQLALDDNGRKTSRAGWTTAVLAMALIGACAYGYYRLAGNEPLLAQFPAVQSSLSAVSQRITDAEEKFQTWSANWDGMNSRVAKVEQGARANLRLAKDYAVEQTGKVHHEMQAEMNNRSRSTDESISKLEATHAEDQEQIAQLKQELAVVRSDTSEQLARSRRETGQEVGNLRSEVGRNRNDFDAVARNLEKRRVEFEIGREQTREVAPGVTLTVSGTNVSYQRVEGRLHVISDGRILWIRGQGIQQPVRFYSHQDQRPYELVFTRVSKEGAVGYVFVPGAPTAISQITEDAGTVAVNSAPVTDPAVIQ